MFDNRALDLAGGIYAGGPDSYLVNNTVVSNTAWSAGGIFLLDGVLSNTLVVSNSAYWDAGGVQWSGGRAGYNDVWGNTCVNAGCGPDYGTGGSPRPASDINADPLFIGSGDPAARYHLRQDSPCIDQGTDKGLVPGVDYDARSRPALGGYDIGFDEVWRRICLPLVLRNS